MKETGLMIWLMDRAVIYIMTDQFTLASGSSTNRVASESRNGLTEPGMKGIIRTA